MTKADISVLFIGSKGDIHIETAIEFLRTNFKDAQVRLGEWGDKLPENECAVSDFAHFLR